MIKEYIHMAVVVLVGLLIAVWTMAPAFAQGNSNVCPDPFETKDDAEFDGELNDIIPGEGVEFCVKGSTDVVTGVGDGQTTLFGILNNGHDVSHYVFYNNDWSCDNPEWTDAPFCRGPSDPTPTETPEPEPEYVAPSATLTGECGVVDGTLTGGSEEEFFQLAGPNGYDEWGGALTLKPGEEITFSEDVEQEGMYSLYTSPRFPTDSESTLRATVDVECDTTPVVDTETVEDELPNAGLENAGAIAVFGLMLLGVGAWITKNDGWMR